MYQIYQCIRVHKTLLRLDYFNLVSEFIVEVYVVVTRQQWFWIFTLLVFKNVLSLASKLF